MMKKIMLASLLLILVSTVSAQSLQNFDYSPENDFERSLTGSESFNQTINFTSEADQSLPLGVRVTVDSNSTEFESDDVGAEFDVSGIIQDSESIRDLSFSSRLSDGDLVYFGTLAENSDMLRESSENSVELEIQSHPAISPDSFSFDFDIRSTPGLGTETENGTTSDGSADIEVGGGNVVVNLDDSDSEANVSVESYDESTIAPPGSESRFVKGLAVDVQNNGQKVKSNGSLTFSYSQKVVDDNNLDEGSMQVYFFNETTSEWETDSVVSQEIDEDENTVTADVSHFSTYSVFAEEQEDDEDSGGGGSSTVISPTSDQETNQEEETSNQTQSDQPENNTQETTQEEQQQDNQTQDQQDTEETQQEDNQQQSQDQSITGQFLGSPTNIGGLIVGLLVAMIAALQYSGRIEIQALVETVREKLEN